jgi:Ca-activated chloride channel family protein
MLYRFADPQYLLLLLGLPLLAVWYWKVRSRKGATIQYSHLGLVRVAANARAARSRHVVFALRALALGALVVAFARPQSGVTGEEVLTEGVDIMLVIDLSTSMLAEDLQPNRVDAAKRVASEFVQGRNNDRIGLVVFAGEAFTQSPLTLDYGIVRTLLDEIEVGIIEDGTAIGLGMATAVKRLRDSEAESKVMILLTDGRNNTGEIDPVTAAQMAQAFDIRIYAIGAGTHGEAPYPQDDPFFGRRYVNIRVDIDEEALQETAALTGGRYFRATDNESLASIYREIDDLETTEIEVQHYTRYGELFHYPLMLGLLLVVAEVGLANTALRKIP